MREAAVISTLADYYPSVSQEHNTQNSTSRGLKEKSEKRTFSFKTTAQKFHFSCVTNTISLGAGGTQKEKI